MVTLLSLLTSLLTLVLIVWLLATVFTGDSRGSDSRSNFRSRWRRGYVGLGLVGPGQALWTLGDADGARSVLPSPRPRDQLDGIA